MFQHICNCIAHSGCEGTAGNTMEYIKKAVQLPCEIIEIDVRKKEGKLYLSHNPICKEEELVPFEQAITYICEKSHQYVNCDLKEDIILEVIHELKRLKMLERSIFTGELSEEIFMQMDTCRENVFLNIENVLSNIGTYLLDEKIFELIKEKYDGIAGINMDYTHVNRDMVDVAHKVGLKVAVWTVDQEADMIQLLTSKVDSITTHQVYQLKEMQEKRRYNREYDIFCIGPISKDIMIDEYKKIEELIGGAVIQSGYATANCTYQTAVFTKFNPMEIQIEEAFTESDIDVYWKYSKETTSIRNQYFTADKEERICTLLNLAEPITMQDLPNIPAKIYHFAGLVKGDFHSQIFKEAASKAKVAVDAQGLLRKADSNGTMLYEDWKEKYEYLPFIDYFKVDAKEAEIMTGTSDTYEAARKLSAWGAKEVMVTHNTEVIIYDGKELHRCPIKARNLEGRTGRGDSCFATYIACRNNQGIKTALVVATALVSLKMESKGPFRGTYKDVLKYIEMYY